MLVVRAYLARAATGYFGMVGSRSSESRANINPVRAIDAFSEGLDLGDLRFDLRGARAMGREMHPFDASFLCE